MQRLTAKEISPRGWLKEQLEIQARGLAGNLDKVWPDVRDSKWVGGSREGWERVPYWLDGFIPLAFLLRDEDMIVRAKRYIDKILAGQCEDGWICPCSEEERKNYDVWALFLILKVLVVWQECSDDGRIEEAVYRALFEYRDHIRTDAPHGWAAARWYECLIPLLWLYERRPEPWMKELAHILKIEGTDFSAAGPLWKKTDKKWTMYTHVVNAAMSLKAGPLYRRFLQKEGRVPDKDAERMFQLLEKYHGTAVGHFTGDECLSGTSPIHGTELCGVVEAMYSYEWLFALTEKSVWADRLEMLAFNALPAAVSPDMWSHQYDQQSNQIACTVQNEPSVFNTNSPDANVFGLEPNFGCCTANFGQGFPKFALSAFLRQGEDTLVSAALVPCEVRTVLGKTPVHVVLDTLYPFRGKLVYTVEGEGEFALKLRIPSSCVSFTVNGREEKAEDGFYTVRKRWSGQETVTVGLRFEVRLMPRPRGLYAVARGPLVYALPIPERRERREYEKDGVERRYPYCDYDVLPVGEWQFALCGEEFSVQERAFEAPFTPDAPPVCLETDAVPIAWGYRKGQKAVCRETPRSRTPLGSRKKVTLIPYGCTNLRMTELPLVRLEH